MNILQHNITVQKIALAFAFTLVASFSYGGEGLHQVGQPGEPGARVGIEKESDCTGQQGLGHASPSKVNGQNQVESYRKDLERTKAELQQKQAPNNPRPVHQTMH